jgi:hypothetical protein
VLVSLMPSLELLRVELFVISILLNMRNNLKSRMWKS